jgi:hypothetical protein
MCAAADFKCRECLLPWTHFCTHTAAIYHHYVYVHAPVCACLQSSSSLVVMTSSASIAPAYSVLVVVWMCVCVWQTTYKALPVMLQCVANPHF